MVRKILSFYTRYFVVWILLFGIAACFWPGPFIRCEKGATLALTKTIERPLPDWLRLGSAMSWFFALTMFGIGAVLTAEDFKRIGQRPLIVLIGSAAQFTIMPLGAFALAKIFRLPPELAVGIVLTGSAPGAMASNVMSYIAGADTAYSVSLTTVSTLLCPILTPLLTLLLAGAKLDVPFLAMVLNVVKIVIVPLFAGFAVRHYFKVLAEKILPVFPAISVTFIIFICSLVIALNRDYLGNVTSLIFTVAILLNLYGMFFGYGVGMMFGFETARKRTLSIEIGMQNAGLGTILAMEHFGKRAAMPAAIFVFICIITASIAASIWRKKPVQPNGGREGLRPPNAG